MTKRRPPASRHEAISRACGVLGYEAASEAAHLSAKWLRQCGDPDGSDELSLVAALRLDKALLAQDEDPALMGWYGAQLEAAVAATGGPDVLFHLRRAAAELQAATALLQAHNPDGRGPPAASVARALAEIAAKAGTLMLLAGDGFDRERDHLLHARQAPLPKLVRGGG